jgi:hypothetical protein
MSGITNAEATNLVNGWLGVAAYTPATAPIMLALATATGTASAAGTEVVGGSYARKAITFAAPSNGATSNNAAINFTSMPAVTVNGIDIYDSSGTPVRRAFAPLTAAKTTGSGDTLSFAAGSITASLA